MVSQDSNDKLEASHVHPRTEEASSDAASEPVTPHDASHGSLVDHFFRHEYAHLVASLTRRLGVRHWDLVEDVVQGALERALRSWSLRGVPPNPTAWLYRVAYHRALDQLRRDLRWSPRSLAGADEPWSLTTTEVPDETTIDDDLLRMLFVCCDDAVPTESQVVLALKTLCGFGVSEIAKAMLSQESTIAKRLTRAKERLREKGIEPALLTAEAIVERLPRVQLVIYLLFNEGYCSSVPEKLVREDLCEEAVRLALHLAEHPLTRGPATAALLALLLFHAARLPARLDAAGNLALLHEQDRAQWDQRLMREAFAWFRRATRGEHVTRYHAEAWIAAEHCHAGSFDETHWSRIVDAYDLLMRLAPSPIHALNRAIAITQRDGPARGLAELDRISADQALKRYYLWHAVRADFLIRLGQTGAARRELEQAVALTVTDAERRLLVERLNRLAGLDDSRSEASESKSRRS